MKYIYLLAMILSVLLAVAGGLITWHSVAIMVDMDNKNLEYIERLNQKIEGLENIIKFMNEKIKSERKNERPTTPKI